MSEAGGTTNELNELNNSPLEENKDNSKTVSNKKEEVDDLSPSSSDNIKKQVPESNNIKTSNGSIPKDKVALKLILASGKSAEFIFPHFASVGKVTEFVYKNWPEEWADEKDSITSHHVLRLIYQGRFLHENVTFVALNLTPGKRTVMHLVPREKLPQLSPDDIEKSPKTSERSCCCNII